MPERVITLSVLRDVMGEMQAQPIAKLKLTETSIERKAKTDRVCPKCSQKPAYQSALYKCACGYETKTWQGLKLIIAGTGEDASKQKLKELGDESQAILTRMGIDEFQRYTDDTLKTFGATVSDPKSADNLQKILIASKLLGEVAIARWNDAYEYHIALVTVSDSNTVLLKEIIPINLVQRQETMKVDFKRFTPEQIAKAKEFVAQLPEADEDTLTAHDHREIGLDAPEAVSSKVKDLESILEMAPIAQ